MSTQYINKEKFINSVTDDMVELLNKLYEPGSAEMKLLDFTEKLNSLEDPMKKIIDKVVVINSEKFTELGSFSNGMNALMFGLELLGEWQKRAAEILEISEEDLFSRGPVNSFKNITLESLVQLHRSVLEIIKDKLKAYDEAGCLSKFQKDFSDDLVNMLESSNKHVESAYTQKVSSEKIVDIFFPNKSILNAKKVDFTREEIYELVNEFYCFGESLKDWITLFEKHELVKITEDSEFLTDVLCETIHYYIIYLTKNAMDREISEKASTVNDDTAL